MIDVHIPKMGMSTVEVDIVEIFITIGAHVNAEERLIMVDAEKASIDVVAPVSGTVSELLVAEGEVREVGDIVVRIEPDN